MNIFVFTGVNFQIKKAPVLEYLWNTIAGSYSSTLINGSTTDGGKVIGTFSFGVSDQSNEGASLDTVKGNYSTIDAETSIAIDIDGILSGSDTDGCQYSGNVTVPNSSVNVYKLVL